ncbi:MAG TPA: hypothetical protein VF553_13130 [Pyrinomonadaceae bacterium]|jgi:hypothetical protein
MSSETVNRGQPTSRRADEEAKSRTCPACGAAARRHQAGFCSTCGRSLEDGYLPADALRSSYHLQHRARASRKPQDAPPRVHISSGFTSTDSNAAATTALAFMTYSLVPYLGILFCPGAVIMGVIGFFYSLHMPHRGGRRASCASVTFGLLILGVQILLWWIIIKVPEWTRPF